MRAFIIWGLCLFSCMAEEMPPAALKMMAALDKNVDCNWQRTPLKDVLAALSTSEGLKITIDPAAAALSSRPVSIHVTNTSLGEVLNRLSNRCALDAMFRGDGTIVVVPSPGATPVPDWAEDPRPVRDFKLGHYLRLPPPGGWLDPVAALGADDAAALVKPTSAAWTALLDSHLKRLEEWHVAHSSPSAGLIEFLKTHPDIRREFWCALDPRFDDATAACRIFDELRTADEKRFITNFRVAIAIAVVHDTPQAAISSRYYTLWMVTDAQFGKTLTYRELWNYFTDPKRQGQFLFKPKDLAWPMLVHLVDLDVSQAEIDWALSQYGGKKIDLTTLYSSVPYDNAKLAHTGTRLGDQPYVLANLRSLGGVCVDQAHFASRVAKIFGVPSLKCGGSGRYGGAGHAWSGYLAAKGKAPELLFTGRYQFDFYYTGTAFDPQIRTEVLDRDVELLYAGVSGAWESWAEAAHLARMARNLEDQPALATTIAREAVKRNPLVAEAWRALLRVVPPAEAEKAWLNLAKAAATFPDLTWEGLRLALERIPAADKCRQRLYENAYALAGNAKRPDVQIQIRLAQIGELAIAKQNKEVIQLAFDTVRANVKEGTLIMPLVKRVVELANGFKESDPAFRMGVVKDTFAKLATDFPKARGGDVSPAWEEWQQLTGSLK